MSPLEYDLKQLIIDALHLEDITPADIDSSAPLFVDGLGLDSIDALELGVAIKKKYNIILQADSDNLKHHFESIASLARFIENNR